MPGAGAGMGLDVRLRELGLQGEATADPGVGGGRTGLWGRMGW